MQAAAQLAAFITSSPDFASTFMTTSSRRSRTFRQSGQSSLQLGQPLTLAHHLYRLGLDLTSFFCVLGKSFLLGAPTTAPSSYFLQVLHLNRLRSGVGPHAAVRIQAGIYPARFDFADIPSAIFEGVPLRGRYVFVPRAVPTNARAPQPRKTEITHNRDQFLIYSVR